MFVKHPEVRVLVPLNSDGKLDTPNAIFEGDYIPWDFDRDKFTGGSPFVSCYVNERFERVSKISIKRGDRETVQFVYRQVS